jgi:hypothetical protein
MSEPTKAPPAEDCVVKSFAPDGSVYIKRNLSPEAATVELIHLRSIGHQQIRLLRPLAPGGTPNQEAVRT